MWLVFLTLILLTRFSQRGSLVSGGGQWADHVPRGCRRLIGISRRWGWARHLPGGWPDGGPWSTGGKWMQRLAALAHTPIPDLTWLNSPNPCFPPIFTLLFLFTPICETACALYPPGFQAVGAPSSHVIPHSYLQSFPPLFTHRNPQVPSEKQILQISENL